MRTVLAIGGPARVKLGERIVNEMLRRGATLYDAKPYPGRITLIRSEVHHRSTDLHLGWIGVAAGGVDLRQVPGDHTYILTRDNIGPAARQMQICLREAQSEESARGSLEPALRLPARAA